MLTPPRKHARVRMGHGQHIEGVKCFKCYEYDIARRSEELTLISVTIISFYCLLLDARILKLNRQFRHSFDNILNSYNNFEKPQTRHAQYK